MKYVRMPIEIESPEQMGYSTLRCNLTESSMSDALFKDLDFDLKQLVLCYGHHLGKPELRELIAAEHIGINASQVILTAGAATALFICNTAILQKGDELLVMHPNYGTNIETPRAIGSQVNFIELELGNDFKPDFKKIRNQLSPNTRLISITSPHNPTGMVLSENELAQFIELAEANNCFLLVDETYRDIPLSKPISLAASMSKNVISVSSVSKAYGLPGLRMGWLITQNETLLENFLAAKEQISICNSVVDEELTYQFLVKKEKHLQRLTQHLQTNYTILKSWLNKHQQLQYVLPEGGAVCFPKIKSEIDYDKFYALLNQKYGTYVGPGHWFEMDKSYMRIGFGWPSSEELTEGLNSIDAVFKEF